MFRRTNNINMNRNLFFKRAFFVFSINIFVTGGVDIGLLNTLNWSILTKLNKP